MRKKFIAAAAAIVAIMPILSSCGAGGEEKSGGKPQIYASFYTMYEFAKLAAGDKADVTELCPSGTEPHDFELTARDAAELENADILVYNGLGMESWIGGVVDALDQNSITLVETSKNVPQPTDNSDPHVWLNPDNALAQIKSISDALIEVDPQNSEYYTERYNECKAETDKLKEEYNAAKAGFSRTEIVTVHEAYAGLCEVLGLTSMSVSGFDPTSEPSPARTAEIEEFIKSRGVKYIFTEPLISDSIASAIASDTGCGMLTLDPFEGSTEKKDYFTIMRENLAVLKTALD